MNDALDKLGGKFYEFQGDNEYTQHYKWLVPCYFKPFEYSEEYKSLIYFEISTVTVEKSLVFNREIIDFGEMAVGVRKIEELLITNKGKVPAELRMEVLPFFSGFSVLNALRTIQPGKTNILVIEFKPHDQQHFDEDLKVYSKTSTLSIKLKGQGVRPEVKVSPEEGLINCGSILPNEFSERTFKIQNISTFNVSFILKTLSVGIQNMNHCQAFEFIPAQGMIEAKKDIEIKVYYKPDRVSENFYQLLLIDVPNQKAEKKVFLYGSCFPRQAYIRNYHPYLAIPLSKDLPEKLESTLDFLKISDNEIIYSPENSKITLEFKKVVEGVIDDEYYKKMLIFGSCKLIDSKLEKPCNYELILPVLNFI